MSTPKPSGITAQVIRPREWYTVSWDDVAGADYYECQHQDEAHVSQLRKPESALIAVPRGTRRFTAIRNVVGGEPSGWVRVTLNDEGSIVDIDGDDEKPPPDQAPNPPRNPTASELTTTSTRLVWDAPAAGGTAVDHYHVSWSKAGGTGTGEDTSDNRELLVTGLDADSDYAAAISAVSAAGLPSRTVPVYWHTEADEVVPPPEQPPQNPTGLRLVSTDPAYASASVAWTAAADAEFWEVELEGVFPRPRKANAAEYTFSDLAENTLYGYRVRAVRTGAGGKLLRSGWARGEFTYQGSKPPPPEPVPTPRNVRAHCISHNSTKVEWDLDASVIEYAVWLVGAEDAAQRTQDTLVTLRGLTSNTSYTAYVVAYDENGRSSEPGSVTFKTGVPEPPPDEDPDTDTAADWPAPRLEVVPTQHGRVRATWDDPATSEKPTSGMGFPFWHVSLDQRTWYFTRERQYEFDVGHGGELFVSVYGVWDNTLTGIATQGVAL